MTLFMKIQQTFTQYKIPFLFGTIGLICMIGLIQTIHDLTILTQKRQKIPYIFMGEQFEELKPFLKNEQKIGYMAQPNPKGGENVIFLTQGQMILAPHILDWNNPNHRFVILEAKSAFWGMGMVKRLNGLVIKRYPSGLLLLERSDF